MNTIFAAGEAIQNGINAAGGGLQPGGANLTLESLIGTILNILLLVVGALAVAFIVIGGVKYITSGGDEKKVASAKNTLLYAVMGLLVAILARVIVGVVMNLLTKGGISGTGVTG